jgi:hypothetical protein
MFAIVIVAICGPTYFLIWVLSWRKEQKLLENAKKKASQVFDAKLWRKNQWELLRRKRSMGKPVSGDAEKGERPY